MRFLIVDFAYNPIRFENIETIDDIKKISQEFQDSEIYVNFGRCVYLEDDAGQTYLDYQGPVLLINNIKI